MSYLIPPLLLGLALVGAWGWSFAPVPGWMVSGLALGPVVVLAALLERVRPERRSSLPFDLPFHVEASHYLLNYQLGYALALGACELLQELLALLANAGVGWPSLWPTSLPMVLQVVWAAFVAEAVSYWQHRAAHRWRWLWKFHALHHSGERLNLLRAGRFHFVDIGSGAFLVFAPLVVLGAPEEVVVWAATLAGAMGVWQHANIRMRTPRWADLLICTPAVHRHHHSQAPDESEQNFGTFLMVFDQVLGSYGRPRPSGPRAYGVVDDPVARSRGFWAQAWRPFWRR